MVTIANAIYDYVFKYLMQDTKAASVLLGALLGTKVVDLKMKNNEYAVKAKNRLDVLRIDFSATIITLIFVTFLVLKLLKSSFVRL